MIDLAELTALQLVALGARLRRIAEGPAQSTAAIADALAHRVFDELGGSLALVRLYRTQRYAALGPALAGFARAAAPHPLAEDARCAVLIATRGNQPEWNSVERSVGYRAIPLSPSTAPVIGAVVDHLDALGDAATREFFLPDAVESPVIPRDFVQRHGIRSVIGMGGPMPDGEQLALLLFATTQVPAEVAHELDTLGVQVRIALLDACDHGYAPAAAAALRSQLLDNLLRLQEYRLQRQADQSAQERAQLLARTTQLEEASGNQAAASADRVRRAQRAMLNVIDDLRDVRDRLEQRVVERTAELAARNAELEQFAYIASHDLQEPLRTVAGYLQLIEQRYADRLDGDAHDFIRFAVEGAHRMQALIEALLSYSRLSSRAHTPAWVALDDVLDEVLRSLDRAIGDADAKISRAPLPEIRGDRIQLGQLFQNLIANALKFRGEAPARIEIAAERDGDRLVIRVRDHGIGFDNRHAERIFAVFRRLQRKHAGTGIGLAICKKIVERHQGTIRASSSPGDGATFEVSLPCEPPMELQ